MRRESAIAQCIDPADDRIWVTANGYISRIAFARSPNSGTFYMLGSMGLAPAIALGIALSRPGQPVGVIDGDGNLLMNAGILHNVAAEHAANFLHVCLNNGSYQGTGGQPTNVKAGTLAAMASAVGYAKAVVVTDEISLLSALAQHADGATFIEAIISEPDEQDPPRVTLSCSEISEAVRRRLFKFS